MGLLVLSAQDVLLASSALSPDALVGLMALVFVRLHYQNCISLPRRTSITTGTYTALFMPGRVDGFGTTIKTVSVPGPGVREGTQATTLVLDEQNGAVRAVVNANSLTALRNAAGSLLATRLLGPTSPRTLLAFGAGWQIAAHIKLFLRSISSLECCIIVNRSNNSRLACLQNDLRGLFPNVNFSSHELAAENLRSIVSSADIICTATSSTEPLFKADWVKSGTHINLIGSYTPKMAEVDFGLIKRAGKVLVDSKEACLMEAGEIIGAGLSHHDLVEVGEAAEASGRGISDVLDVVKTAGDVTIFKSVGVGLQDTVITSAVLDKAVSLGLGVQVPTYHD